MHRRNDLPEHAGFTIVELLIVIVVIAILAAITIGAYNGIQQRARIAVVTSDLETFGKKLALYYAENDSYPSTTGQLASLEWKASWDSYQQKSGGNLVYCAVTSGPDAKFLVAARTADYKAFTYSADAGLQSYTDGSWTGAGTTDCPALFGFPTSGARFYTQGYQPPAWGAPGLRVWAGGTV